MPSSSPSISEPVNATKLTPLLFTNGSIRTNTDTSKSNDASTCTMFFQELLTIPHYALPICSMQLLKYSIVLVPVISLSHLSTTYLTAVSLGSMTANVMGYSLLLRLTSGLDTVFSSAWTLSKLRLVGLWVQRMGGLFFLFIQSDRGLMEVGSCGYGIRAHCM
ncbi:hypothetical protein H2248_007726 [Termitomyces sp. 'cryptogamus']|nr:hypothetical protein H2248_007726 [Termitomyces sp. 'cryptogamus']